MPLLAAFGFDAAKNEPHKDPSSRLFFRRAAEPGRLPPGIKAGSRLVCSPDCNTATDDQITDGDATVFKSCRPREDLSNQYFLAKIGVDTAENFEVDLGGNIGGTLEIWRGRKSKCTKFEM